MCVVRVNLNGLFVKRMAFPRSKYIYMLCTRVQLIIICIVRRLDVIHAIIPLSLAGLYISLFVTRHCSGMDNAPAPFRIGSSESSGNVSDNSSCSENFTGEPAEYDPQVSQFVTGIIVVPQQP